MEQKRKRFEVWGFPSKGKVLWGTNSRAVGWMLLTLGVVVCRWDVELRLMDTVGNTQIASW